LLDRFGLRRGMSIAVALWSLASGLHAVLASFFGFCFARAVLGFGEGATFPGGLRTAMDSLPSQRQSRGIAIAYSGASLGAIITPLIIIPLAAVCGWRSAFLFMSIAGLLWVYLWLKTANFPQRASNSRIRTVLPNPFEARFWSLVASYGLGALPLAPILYMAPLYLVRVLNFSQSELAKVLWIPPLGWETGYFFWGWFADRLAAENRRPTWLFSMLAVLGLPIGTVTHFRTSAIVLALMFWMMFVAAGFVIVSLRTSARAYRKEQTALVAGIGAGSWSAIVAVVMPLLGRMFDAKNFGGAFLLVAVIPVVGTILWFLLTMRKTNATPAPLSASR